MDEFQMEPVIIANPKFCGFDARLLVCCLVFFDILRCYLTFRESRGFTIGIMALIFACLNIMIFFGATYSNEKYLKWSLKVLRIQIGFDGFQVLLCPVIAASSVASGIIPREPLLMIFVGSDHHNDLFLKGIFVGYIVEIASILLLGSQVLKYVIVSRLWIHAKATGGVP